MHRQETPGAWYYRHRKGVLGPVSGDELRFLALTGKVNSETLVRSSGSDEWIEYARSPAAVVVRTQERSGTAAAATALHEPPVQALAIGGATPAAGNPALSPALSPTLDGTAHDKNLQFVSFAAVLALILLAVLLSIFWNTDPRAKRVASSGSRGSDGASPDGREGPSGTGSAKLTGSASSAVGTSAGSSEAASPEDTATVAADAATETADDAVASTDSDPAAASSTDPQTSSIEDSAMAEANSAEDEEKVPPTLEQEPMPDLSDERFGVALADKAVAKAPEKNTKPRPTRTALQQSDLSSRSGVGREKAVAESGGTVESEKAVARALEWLRRIQRVNGSWDFQEVGKDAQAGSLHSPLGATAMATLCFLGSGSTTRTGPDKELVSRAFEFMVSQAGQGVDGSDSMYVHALVTLCLTELVTMEPGEKKYRKHAEDAVGYIERAQDPTGGGWRYSFQSPGDTSVTGWDVMALQSGQSGGIKLDRVVVDRAQLFLDSVSESGGAAYSYTPGTPATPSMTAVGLLCRMYLGWPHDSGPLREGIHRLSTAGVSRDDMYFNYYATIALHHYGGTEWENWNATMREQLVTTQITEGAAAGSWKVTDPHGVSGGQIYQTCLSVLTLEVYYRYLPLYRP